MAFQSGFLKKGSPYLVTILCVVASVVTAYGAEDTISVGGRLYEFDEKSHYEITSASSFDVVTHQNTLGTFSISGEVSAAGSTESSPSYSVKMGNMDFYYSYDASKMDMPETEWHITEDKTKKVDTLTLDENIANGTIIVQSSRDGKKWITDVIKTNVFAADTEVDLTEPIYSTKQIQLENGCYYRVIAAYCLQRKTGERSVGPISLDNIEKKKIAEVYEFYAINSEVAKTTAAASTTPRKELGKKVKTGKDNGFSGDDEIDKNDPHFGWDLGTFVVNGYTRETADNGTPVFLKNVGDKVTLWFTLKQDIDALNGNSTLSISEDTNGYDQHFEIEQTNFKRGTLIVRYTDHEGNVHEPIVYTDFLEANAVTGADTRVQLFEEGDYEVSLDYEIKDNPRQIGPVSVIPTYTNYKMAFEFAIRNGNCMVYPFDISTGAELSDNAVSLNGFKLDMARSRYLTIDVSRAVLKAGPDGSLVEDVRFNRPAKDGESYIDEGIYTFTVKNLYTGESTTKTIYVGTEKHHLALSKNGIELTTLNEKVAQGATIGDDGTITEFVPDSEPESEMPVSQLPKSQTVVETVPSSAMPVDNAVLADSNESHNVFGGAESLFVLVVIAGGIVAAIFVFLKKRRAEKAGDDK